jgi:hypothetical protein
MGKEVHTKAVLFMSNTAQEVADDFVKYYNRQAEDQNFIPITKKSHEEAKQKAEKERSDRIGKELIEEDRKKEKEFRDDYLIPAMKKLDIDIPLLGNVWYLRSLEYILRVLHRRVEDTHPENNTALPEDLEFVWSSSPVMPLMVKRFGEEGADNLKEIFNKIALGNSVWRNVYPWIVQMPK